MGSASGPASGGQRSRIRGLSCLIREAGPFSNELLAHVRCSLLVEQIRFLGGKRLQRQRACPSDLPRQRRGHSRERGLLHCALTRLHFPPAFPPVLQTPSIRRRVHRWGLPGDLQRREHRQEILRDRMIGSVDSTLHRRDHFSSVRRAKEPEHQVPILRVGRLSSRTTLPACPSILSCSEIAVAAPPPSAGRRSRSGRSP